MEDIAQAFLKRPGVILLVVLGFVGPTLGFSLLQPSVYEASHNLIAKEAIRRLGLSRMEPDELLGNLSVEQEPGTYFINLSYKDANPQRAQRIANYYVAEVSSKRISKESAATVEGDITVRVWQAASVPSTPVRPNLARNAALALILGLAVGPVLAIWMDERT